MGARSSPMSDPDAWSVDTCPTCGQEAWSRERADETVEYTQPPNKYEDDRWRIWRGITKLIGPGPLLENIWRLVFPPRLDN